MNHKVSMVSTALAFIFFLAACSGPTTDNVAVEPVAPSTAATPEATPSSQSPSPSPEATPSPTLIELTADDLVVALPTNKQMSKIQGYKFRENTDWAGGGDEGPEWSNNTPLTKEQASMISFGETRAVKPEKCTATSQFISNFNGPYGVPARWAVPSYITAAAYSKRANDDPYFKKNLVYLWVTSSLLMPDGEASNWVTNWVNMSQKCTKYTVINSDGDIKKINTTNDQDNFEFQSSGGALFQIGTKKHSNSLSGNQTIVINEVIGKTLFNNFFVILGSSRESLTRAFEVYNVLADNLAEVQGVTRTPVDLATSKKVTPNPDAYIPLSVPSSEIS